ncbi:MAG: hypothetical protein ACTSRK_09280 [Promethearchaeota archaeon]
MIRNPLKLFIDQEIVLDQEEVPESDCIFAECTEFQNCHHIYSKRTSFLVKYKYFNTVGEKIYMKWQ